jgi:hypothetical protein
MNSVVNENEFSGEKAQKTLAKPVASAPDEAPSAVQNGKAAVSLEVSWQVAPAQNVAILDLSDESTDNDLSPLTPTRPAATAAPTGQQKCKYL